MKNNKNESNDNHTAILSQKNPWNNNDNSVWLASTISLIRNIEKFKFPGKLASDRRKQIITLVSKDLINSPHLQNPKLFMAEDLNYIEKEFLVEHYLTAKSFHQAHTGEAFIIDNTGEFLSSINMQDHIHLQITDCKGELENSWNKLVKIETTLGKSVNYSFSPKFGFLTADPTQCGTAILVYSFIQVPALLQTDKLEEILESLDDESIAITGLQGDPHELIGDILVIHNNYTLGLTEENIISTLRTFVTKIVIEEKGARNKLKSENNTSIKDKISRAYGILIHSYQIEAIEALNALSLIKLGVDLGWVTGLSMARINELMFKCRRAHFLNEMQLSPQITPIELGLKRAEYLHSALKSLVLSP